MSSRLDANWNLVEGRVAHLVRLHLRRAFDDLRQRLDHAGVGAAGVRLCVLFLIPHADADRVRSARGNEGDLVLEALLFTKNGNDVRVEELGELCCATGLEME